MPKRSLSAPRPRRLRRALLGVGVAAAALSGLWIAIHEVPGFGPALADGVRAVVGPGPVAWAEDVAYDVADRINRLRYRGAAPKTFWSPPPEAAPAPTPKPPRGQATERPARGAEPPPAFEPPYPAVAAEGDGAWIAMADAAAPDQPPVMWKAVVHPDPRRSFAAVAVVAVDLPRVELRLVAGTAEPASSRVPAERRSGLIPADEDGDLIAAFNGGFKAMHGHYGMMLGGDTFVIPRDIACTVALYGDGAVRIRTWTDVRDDEPRMAAYRQTPPCLIERGELHRALSETNRNWGATVSGETIIRRSAIGVDATGARLFYALGEAVTAQSIARAMQVAGAHDAAQLDVNHSYPRFLLFARGAPGDRPHAGEALIPDVKFKPADYTVEPSPRDFFYLVRRRTTS